MLVLLIAVPLACAAAAFAVPWNRVRPWLLPVAGTAHFALMVRALSNPPAPEYGGWLLLDQLGRLLLGLTSLLYLLCSVYAVGYLRFRDERPNRLFCTALLVFPAMMTLVIESHHLGLMWVAIEATTLSSAPLLYFNRTPRSLEATWKYLLVGSVGIAIALFGSFFLAYSALHAGLGTSLLFDDLIREAPQLSKPWLHAAFVLLFCGYGTKMGLAPMHTWKPDAYGEAPGVVGALLAGGLTNCAFLAVLRFYQICNSAGEGAFAREILVLMGLFSMAVAAVFMIRQRDYKRMLAYSSVEQMGILILGIGLGGPAVFGSLFHMINNGLMKGVTFLAAGNVHRAYGSKRTEDVSGTLWRLPFTGWMFLLGLFAITGSPPFAPFLSEMTILSGAVQGGRYVIAGLFLSFLLVIFLGMAATILALVQGRPSARVEGTKFRDGFLTGAPILVFALLVLLLGVHVPAGLEKALREAAAFVERGPQ
ncbi:MAG: hydrogenase [Planctomycetes bacterium]|nr:hydrogenase [Planctomycetota bacterium]